MAEETIFHIGYDPVLTELRQQVLERAGYRVISVIGNEDLRASDRSLSVDAVVVGSGGTFDERIDAIAWVRENLPGVPLLAMCAAPEEVFPPGVSSFLADTVRDWLIAVDSILEKARRDARARAAQR